MKKAIGLLLTILLLTSFAEARKRTANRVKKSKKQYSMTYDKIWFARLTHKQKVTYLKTMANLSKKISRSKRYSSNNNPLLIFFPHAFAQSREVISNGYMRTTTFEDFFNNKDFGELQPRYRDGKPSCP